MPQLEGIKREVYDSTPEVLPKSARILYFTNMEKPLRKSQQRQQLESREALLRELRETLQVGETLQDSLTASRKEIEKELRGTLQVELKATLQEIKEDNGGFLKKLAAILLGIGFIVSFFVYTYVPTLVSKQVGEEVGKEIKEVNKELGSIKERLVKLETTNDLLPTLRKKTTGSVEDLKNSLPEARNLLRTAETKDIFVNPEGLAEIGTSLLRRDIGDPEVATLAWDTTTQFINYRTFLNEKLYVPPMSLRPNLGGSFSIPPGVKGVGVIEVSFLNVTVELDRGTWVGNVFKGCIIKYSGDSAELKNNVFIDCEFQVARTPNGRILAQAILESLAPTINLDVF